MIGVFNFTITMLVVLDGALGVRPGHPTQRYRNVVKREMLNAVIEMHEAAGGAR